MANTSPQTIARPFFLAMLVLSLGLCGYLIKGFVDPLVLAGLLAALFHPMQSAFLRFTKGRENLSAFMVLAVMLLILILPISLLLGLLIPQAIDVINGVAKQIGQIDVRELESRPEVGQVLAYLNDLPFVELDIAFIKTQVVSFSKDVGQFLLSSGTRLFSDTATLLFDFSILLFAAFFLVRDGSRIVRLVKYLSPMADDQEDRILRRIQAVTRSVFLGSFFAAVLQGVAGGIGFAIVGIPAIFWGTMMGFASMVPFAGVALIWIPAVGYLISEGRFTAAIFLGLWNALLVGSIDNFLRPFLMQGQSKMSPFYLFMALIGGFQAFGVVGLLYGPLIFAFATVMLYIYKHEYQELLDGASCALSPGMDEDEQSRKDG